MLATNLVEIEKKSALLAKQNSDISIEKYRVGLISDLELRDAQSVTLMLSLGIKMP